MILILKLLTREALAMGSSGNVFSSGVIGSPGFDVTKWFTNSNRHEFILQSTKSFKARPYHTGDSPVTYYVAMINGDRVMLTKQGVLAPNTHYDLTKSITVKIPVTGKSQTFSYVSDYGWINTTK
ncbi:hypothetical protein FC98_GL002755 [Lentilactobacillus kisonensis DSM 19906 = JCM 15041]|uniref:Uncharacterized protein n=1 Tax=Lentilactobacillus kisonensis DSM 19906 = JCM 15041 TaxID=1423766 RepID=A0A0R1NWZ9_9LACO|nr:hypothetical protein FC98_GL002755 [Lentilactobacillus kisonensis DSM 19906 = JCM 15041]